MVLLAHVVVLFLVFYAEWIKSEGGKLISYINAYIWNPERNYLQGNNGYTDIENRLMDKGGGEEGQGEMNRESSMEAYTLTYVKETNGNLLYELKLGLCNNLEG